MLSILVPVHNNRKLVGNCLRSIIDTLDRLRLVEQAEVILMDDQTSPTESIPDLFRTFKQQCKAQVMAFRFKTRQNYSRACAVGLSLTQGSSVLVLSDDMLLTPSYLRTLLAVSALDPSHGIVRGTSPHVEGFPEHQVAAPLPYQSYEDVVAFAQYVESCNGLSFVEDSRLTGDSMLIRRDVIEKIGVMDGRFFGFRGALDFGVRAQRAGIKLICAKGAWLHHVEPTPRDEALLAAEYQHFRQKWGSDLPETDPGTALDTAKLRAAGPAQGPDFQPELEMEMDDVEVF